GSQGVAGQITPITLDWRTAKGWVGGCCDNNFQFWSEKLGVGMAMRKMGSMAKPDVYIIKDGDTITVKTESTFKTSQFSFKLGEKFEENTLDGRKTQTLVSLKDDGSLIQEQEWDGKKTIITRKLVDGQLVVECDMNGVKCTRVYQKA
ncbi:PREDICTED: putative fatty acid-binding protein 5-like protein 3, partial [Leptosomus discolor]|uniref:putative fatty acid-binding protein 5-like protein 3 n=1 Tax=Leptosomus discolor TaxID=188344 RepID=UPI0005226BDF